MTEPQEEMQQGEGEAEQIAQEDAGIIVVPRRKVEVKKSAFAIDVEDLRALENFYGTMEDQMSRARVKNPLPNSIHKKKHAAAAEPLEEGGRKPRKLSKLQKERRAKALIREEIIQEARIKKDITKAKRQAKKKHGCCGSDPSAAARYGCGPRRGYPPMPYQMEAEEEEEDYEPEGYY